MSNTRLQLRSRGLIFAAWLALFACAVAAQEFTTIELPRPGQRQFVTDLADLLDDESEQQIREAAAYAAYDNMKKLEQEQVFSSSGTRLAPGDRANPQSYKVRRAKVGGWRDYFDDQQAAAIDAMLAARPAPPFGYGAPAPAARRA